MRELVGKCRLCGKEIYCADGFLEGVVSEDKQLECLACAQEEPEK